MTRLYHGWAGLGAVVIIASIAGCGSGTGLEPQEYGAVEALALDSLAEVPIDCSAEQQPLPYASELIAFEIGDAGGYGSAKLPEIVLGPPRGGGHATGSLDVLSLGVGGEIVLGFGDRVLRDGPGVDLIVFENAFWVGGDPTVVWAELGEVSVSTDGQRWYTFLCEPERGITWEGCAGWRPVLSYDVCKHQPLDFSTTGGAGFDFADLDIDFVRFVRIRDLATDGAAPSAGFDLDAVGAVYFER